MNLNLQFVISKILMNNFCIFDFRNSRMSLRKRWQNRSTRRNWAQMASTASKKGKIIVVKNMLTRFLLLHKLSFLTENIFHFFSNIIAKENRLIVLGRDRDNEPSYCFVKETKTLPLFFY